MLNTRPGERETWVIHREYIDPQGDVYIEYKDAKGIIHTESKNSANSTQSYQQGYIEGQILEENKQDEQISQTKRADKHISQGLLLGVIVTCVSGLSAGILYFLMNPNQPQPATIINVPRQESSPVPSPLTVVPVVPQTVVKIVPVPPAQPRDQNVNITTQPTVAKPLAKPTTPKAPAKPVAKAPTPAIAPITQPTVVAPVPNSVTNNITNNTNTKPIDVPKSAVTDNNINDPKLTRRDRDLKNEILRTLQDQFSNNQLTVEVNQTDVVVSGSVATPEQLQQIKPRLLSIQGIGDIEVKAIAKAPTN